MYRLNAVKRSLKTAALIALLGSALTGCVVPYDGGYRSSVYVAPPVYVQPYPSGYYYAPGPRFYGGYGGGYYHGGGYGYGRGGYGGGYHH